ncbi:MAG: hypothetical protein ABI743_11540, partial [bacterium]
MNPRNQPRESDPLLGTIWVVTLVTAAVAWAPFLHYDRDLRGFLQALAAILGLTAISGAIMESKIVRSAGTDRPSPSGIRERKQRPMFEPRIVQGAMRDAFVKLDPRREIRNPVMFVVWIGAVLSTLLGVQALGGRGDAPASFVFAVAIWLWFTVLFANFAEAMAEGRGKAQAESLRRSRQDVLAIRLSQPSRELSPVMIPAPELRKGDWVLVAAGDIVPGDGEIVEGIASVDESAITG